MVSLKDDKVRKNVPACAPEQATIKLWETGAGIGQSSVLLSFATCAGGAEGSPATWFGWQPDPSGAAPLPTTSAVTEVALGVAPGAYTHGGCSSTAVTSYSENWAPSTGSGPQGGGSYTSPILHHCLLKNLTAGVKCVFISPHFSSFFSPLIFFCCSRFLPFFSKALFLSLSLRNSDENTRKKTGITTRSLTRRSSQERRLLGKTLTLARSKCLGPPSPSESASPVTRASSSTRR
jgi:hypothetical protein